MAFKSKTEAEIAILPISQGEVTVAIIGTSPLIFNRMSEKVKPTLLLGGGRKTGADRAANLKHNPPEEFRASVYRNCGEKCLTRLAVPSPAFKGAMLTAALDMPGRFGGVVTRVRRGDQDLLARDGLTLELGDRVLAVVPRSEVKRLVGNVVMAAVSM